MTERLKFTEDVIDGLRQLGLTDEEIKEIERQARSLHERRGA